jgi:integrase/recombinase XerD
MNDIIKPFTTALAAEGKSKNTIKNYLVAVNQFLLAHNGRVNAITQESVDSFLSKFNSRNQTQNFKKNAIHKFLTFLLARGQIKTLMNTKMKNVTVGEPEFLTPAEQDKLFMILQSKPKFKRDYTLLSVMIFTGMRVSEVLNLKLSDVRDDFLMIKDSKTGPGKVYMRERLAPILSSYLEPIKDKLGKNDFIFQSNQKSRLTERMVQLQLKKYLRMAGIQKDLSPHSLRHTFAARLIKTAGNLGILQKALRHKHIQSTMRYAHIAEEEVIEAIEKSMEVPEREQKRAKTAQNKGFKRVGK